MKDSAIMNWNKIETLYAEIIGLLISWLMCFPHALWLSVDAFC